MAKLQQLIGQIPHKMALAGGWIDQPFMSELNPEQPGSMVVASIVPDFPAMERSGLSGGTRRIADQIWNGVLPKRKPANLVRELYEAENAGKEEPSGSQDMIGIIYPGISRLDYDIGHDGGLYPSNIEQCVNPDIAHWLESVIYVLPVGPRPAGYNPLGKKKLNPSWVKRLGRSGFDCFDAICSRDIDGLGASLNESMKCWDALLPDILHHHTLTRDLAGILKSYQSRYAGAMYSGCGGGYLYVVSDEPVPGTFKMNVRI